jgi:hypothetical protein
MAVVGKISTLGAGADLHVALTAKSTMRAGVNVLSYGRRYDRDGVIYHGDLHLLSVNALYDYFPMGGKFHVSGGALLYNDNKIDGRANVPAGQLFDLGDDSYRSSTTDPIHGTGTLRLNKFAPMALVGFGNPAHGEKALAISFDVGVAFQGTPSVKLNFAGTACDTNGLNCTSVTNAAFQQSVQDEQAKLNRNISTFKFYPVVQLSLGYRF